MPTPAQPKPVVNKKGKGDKNENEVQCVKLRARYLSLMASVGNLIRMLPHCDDWVWAQDTTDAVKLTQGFEALQTRAQQEGWSQLICIASPQWKRSLKGNLDRLCKAFVASETAVGELQKQYERMIRMQSARVAPDPKVAKKKGPTKSQPAGNGAAHD